MFEQPLQTTYECLPEQVVKYDDPGSRNLI